MSQLVKMDLDDGGFVLVKVMATASGPVRREANFRLSMPRHRRTT